jgi:hypothetical protein
VLIRTIEEFSELSRGKALDSFIAELSNQLQLVEGPYSTPLNSSKQLVLSRVISHMVLSDTSACLYITGWSIAPTSEHLDLFYGYRRSVGEIRPLLEAPVHLFRTDEKDQLVSMLAMVFFFCWDACVFDLAGKTLFRVSHDGWMEFRSVEEQVDAVVSEMKFYNVPLLGF